MTTGLDRIYPKGLLVGVVERVEEDPNAPWHRLIISPAAPVDRVEHVVVLLVEAKDLKFRRCRQITQTKAGLAATASGPPV